MTLQTLPDLCLLQIFDHLPPPDFLQIRLICQRLYHLFPMACGKRTTLNVLIGDSVPESKVVSSHFPQVICHTVWSRIDEWECTQIGRYFAKLHTVNICINLTPIEVCHSVVRLLRDLSHCPVTRLAIWAHFDDLPHHTWTPDRVYIYTHELMGAIAQSFPTLENLSLEIWNKLFALDLSVLSRLRTFCVFTCDSVDMFTDELINHAEPNPNLQIALRNNLVDNCLSSGSLYNFLLYNSNLALKIIDINLSQLYPDLCLHFRPFCALFPSIQSMDLNLEHYSLAQFSRYLARLTILEHLCLHIDFGRYQKIPGYDPLPNQIVPLLSVKQLSLRLVAVTSHQDLIQLDLQQLLPNVEIVTVYSQHCWDCTSFYSIKECLVEIVKPLRQLASLKEIRDGTRPESDPL